ncbi:MAG: hypothetical protein AAGK97_18620, partial [Bacteroidota bacterium]
KQMLIIAGYDARLTWLGTKDLPYTYELQSLVVDNHMICTVYLDGSPVFLDPTEKYIDIYNYAYRIQGKEAMIEDGENYIIEKIPESPYTENNEVLNLSLEFENDHLVGNGQNTYDGNRKSELYYYLGNTPKKEWKERIESFLSSYNKNIVATLTNEPSTEDRSKTIQFDFDVVIKNAITDVGSEKYFTPEYDFFFKDFEMEEDREVDYMFNNVYSLKYKTSIEIEEGWDVQYLPESLDIDNDQYAFKLNYKVDGNQIIYSKELNIKDALLKVSAFENWNADIASLDAFYNDQIILKKN